MSAHLKPFKTFEEQVQILKSRKLAISDDEFAQRILSTVNYYRFSGYAYLRQNKTSPSEEFTHDSSFESILELYEFDRAFRHILLEKLEIVEILARTRIAYFFSKAHICEDNDAHYEPSNFTDLKKHTAFIQILDELIEKNKDTLFVKKHLCSYDGRMPLWAAVEILSFSNVSTLYSIMLTTDQIEISKSLGQTPSYLSNWLWVLSVLRNKCAHYARIYGCKFHPPVELGLSFKRNYPVVRNDTVFAAICVMCKLIPDNQHIDDLVSSLSALFEKYSKSISYDELCFPKNWKTILLSQKKPSSK